MGFLKKYGRGRPDFHELRSLFQLFLEFQEISRPSTNTSQHIRSPLQTHGTLGKATINWAHGPRASAGVSPSGFGERKVERKSLPRLLHKPVERNPGLLVSGPTGQDFTPKPYLSSPHFSTFFNTDFFSSTGKLHDQQGWTWPQGSPTHTARTIQRLRLLQALCLRCWGMIPTPPSIPGSSQTSTSFRNFCGHVNTTESMEDVKLTQSKAQLLMAWIHTEWTGKGKVVKMWKVLFWRLQSSEIDIKAILQIKSAMWSATVCLFIYESERRLY